MFKFSQSSLASRAKLHPALQKVVDEAIKVVDFKILDATRGRSAQELAFKQKRSKAHFGQSAHNYVPAVAMDLFPAPYDWDDTAAFVHLSTIIMPIPAKLGLGVVLRWGGDWNMDGAKTTNDSWDMPHFELHKWQDYVNLPGAKKVAGKSNLYED